MPINKILFIQTLHNKQDRHKISFSFDFNNKNVKKVFRSYCPPPPAMIKVKIGERNANRKKTKINI